MEEDELITAAAAADLLGIRRQTLYAYVSRGVLTRVHGTDARKHRVSTFRRREVVALAEQRRRDRVGVFEIHLDTAVTQLDPAGRLHYRGHDATELAASHSFEGVSEILWGSTLFGDDRRSPAQAETHGEASWEPSDVVREVWGRLERSAPASAAPADRIRVALALLAADPAVRPTREPIAVRSAARTAIVTAAGALGDRPDPWPKRLAEVVTHALATRATPPDRAPQAINAALVLLADHELATSTVSARAAAGTRADLYAALLTGVAAMAGLLHGRASTATTGLLRTAVEHGAEIALAEHDAAQPPGFGHVVYTDADPRADALLDLVLPDHPRLSVAVEDLCLAVRRRAGLAPNVDLALAAMAETLALRPGSAEAVFVLARLAGLTAHVLEEYDHRMRFRPRAVYTGASDQG